MIYDYHYIIIYFIYNVFYLYSALLMYMKFTTVSYLYCPKSTKKERKESSYVHPN